MKKIKEIPFQKIASIPQLIKDFLNGEICVESRFSTAHLHSKIIQKKESFTSEQRSLLYSVVQEQMETLELSEKQKSNLDLLSQENTFCITTGHQLNLFTGPVFFIYKILQTIKLAAVCQNETQDFNIVPVFWMATEDHDFEEINHFRTENHFFEFFANSGGAVGRIQVENLSFIAEFEKEFQNTVYGTELLLMMKRAYKAGRTLAEATKILVHELFAEYGLLIIDGDHPKLKGVLKNTFKKELLQNELFKSTQEQIKIFLDRYGKVQVNTREINLFYLTETRNRIERHGKVYKIVDTDLAFTEDEMLNELQNFPEKFSPNAVLRPVYQEMVLPNLAYIGGNAEIMYWLELPDYFKQVNIPFPFLVPRNSLLFLSEKTLLKGDKLEIPPEDYFKSFAELSRFVALQDSVIPAFLNEKEALLKQQFQEISEIAAQTDVTFKNLVNAEQTRQLKSFERMRKRLLRAEKIKNQEKLDRLHHFYNSVHPGGNWQERVYNFSVFYADLGREWLHNCYEEMNAENSELILFQI